MKQTKRDVAVGVISKILFYGLIAAGIIFSFASCSRGYGCPNAF